MHLRANNNSSSRGRKAREWCFITHCMMCFKLPYYHQQFYFHNHNYYISTYIHSLYKINKEKIKFNKKIKIKKETLGRCIIMQNTYMCVVNYRSPWSLLVVNLTQLFFFSAHSLPHFKSCAGAKFVGACY